MAIRSSILAWRIPWIEEPGGLWSMVSNSQTTLSLSYKVFSAFPVGGLCTPNY